MIERPISRRGLLAVTGGITVAGLGASPALAAPTRPAPPTSLTPWAKDTWHSLDAMTGPTGLVADWIGADLTTPSTYTSPTNIGGYLWSCLMARDLGIITPGESRQRIARTLTTLEGMERHRASGMYYNWYDPRSGEVLTTWPENGNPVDPFVSSVDMGWLGAALWTVANADPSNRKRALDLFWPMRWDVFYDRSFWRPGGANYGGFYTAKPNREGVIELPPLNGVGGSNVWYTETHHYDTAVSEARMVNYLGIFRGQIPPQAYFATWRTFPPDWDWQEIIPTGVTRTYYGIDVYEGAYAYQQMKIVPGWGGSMFEELMPDIFVPEERWGPRSWGINHPAHVRAQRLHGMVEAGYGYWGFSPSANPAGGYREYGVDALGLKPDGYFSDQDNTDYHWQSPPTTYGDGVVTPHASFLAMMHDKDAAVSNLGKIQTELGAYGPGGFFDAAATRSGLLARRHLSLDQSMIMGAIGNVALGGRMRDYFSTRQVARALRPVISIEEFGASL